MWAAPSGLLGCPDLRREWNGGRCDHPETRVVVCGLDATLSCKYCLRRIVFSARFGRRMFGVSIPDKHGTLGEVDGETCSKFLQERVGKWAAEIMDTDPEGGNHMRNVAVLRLLVGNRYGQPYPPSPPKAFITMWNGGNCRHPAVNCEMYGNELSLGCLDCGTDMWFVMRDEDWFDANIRRRSYGTHRARDVMGHVRKHTSTLLVPSMVADKMSDDPERDAVQVAKTVSMLERYGLLKRVALTTTTDLQEMALVMSALNVTREEFEARAGDMAAKMEKNNPRITEDGRKVSVRHGMEAARLTWPCGFEGGGVDVAYYNATGRNKFCPKCGFTPSGKADWRRGCRECGYAGYLLDI